MQQRYGGEGLAAISVNLDEPAEKEKVLKFLREQKATFTNLLLDEPSEVYEKKLHFDSLPCVFVFNKAGEVEKQFKDEFTYADVEKAAVDLLHRQ